MAKPNPSLYSVQKTFFWFAVTSVLLTASLAGIVYIDAKRDWKDYQKAFFKLKAEKATAELKQAASAVDKKELEKLRAEHSAARKTLESNSKSILDLNAKLTAAELEITKTKVVFQDLKQFEDSYRYYYEEYTAHHDPRAASYAAKLAEIKPRVQEAKIKLEKAEKGRDTVQAGLDALLRQEKEAQKKVDQLLDETTRIERKIEAVKPSFAKDLLNAPMLDFIAPTLEIQQVVLENLHDDYHFAKAQKVDRCTTCHMGIDQKGFEDAPQPFRTHPNLDLYLGSMSAHPIEKIGCTTCHGGNGHSVSFIDTAHTPRDEKQKAEWEKKYGWRDLEKWEAKMLPLQYTQAACAKCHTGTVEVPQADKLNLGRNLAVDLGCLNCHKVEGFEGLWKVGPDLTAVASKTDETWVSKWLQDPTRFRPSTKMPRIFHLENQAGADNAKLEDAAIVATAKYLHHHSAHPEVLRAPQGDAAMGEKLIKDLGCLGCHSAAGVTAGTHGPELSSLGSKVNADWLFTWLKDPKRHSATTRMPSLRLSDSEAADITAYLMSQRNEAFDSAAAPKADPKAVDDLILLNLQSKMRHEEAVAQLSKMAPDEKLLYLGERTIAHQGCYSCHDIRGFEQAKSIATELSDEGRKNLHQFDFGYVHDIPHTRQDWIRKKLEDPRVFDHGKVKGYYERLRMPHFGLSEVESEAITTFVLSLTQEEIALEAQDLLTTDEQRIERGRRLIQKLNCQGCHSFDGKDAILRSITEDPGAAPPVLHGQGSKVQEAWLHDFLQHPTTIRPWLKYRMPTFGLTDTETQDIVRYFALLDGRQTSYRGEVLQEVSPDRLAAGKELFEKLQCAKCHQITASSQAMGASFLAPDLTLTKHRLRSDWVIDWIKDPQAMQEGTMMPGFFPDMQSPLPDILGGDAQAQIEAIRDYLYRYDPAAAAESTAS
ncbi:MAG: hypothetical protein MOGMAGMI_00956 [Candidatus Omnitrophica bacterium]|nr:hypothetical protein [Candidatus Omnitrophota bacterium]